MNRVNNFHSGEYMTEELKLGMRYHDHTEGKRGLAFTGAIGSFIFLEVAKAAIAFFTFKFLKNWWNNRKKT